MTPPPPRQTPSIVGRTLGSYRLDELLKQGGMGMVYKAWDLRLKRAVAVKTIRPDVAANPQARQRLEREARAAANLSHPAIATLLDFGQEDGELFLVFELLAGPTLREYAHARRLELGQALGFALQLAQALGAAHAHGIIHRDVKPDNVLVVGEDAVKVLDFGLARIDPDHGVAGSWSSSSGSPLTAEGVVVGTLQYMSPEQIQGLPLDHRTDIFSLGVLLYELLTGTLPFAGGSATEAVARIVHCAPTAPRAHNPELPAEVEQIVLRCLRREPADRYSSAEQLAADLRQVSRSSDHSAATSFAGGPAGPEYYLPRRYARGLFALLQVSYLAMYMAAFRHGQELHEGLGAAFAGILALPAIEALTGAVLGVALVGTAVRLYLLSLVAWDHIQTGVRFRRAFPFFFLLDELWALTPLALLDDFGLIVLPAVVPLAFFPFSQRTLVRSAYATDSAGRVSAG